MEGVDERCREIRRVASHLVEDLRLLSQSTTRRLGLGGSALHVLSLLALHGPQTAGGLAARTGLSSIGVTTVIDRLERAALVARRRHDTDRRSVLVALVPAAFERLAAAGDGPLARLDRVLRFRRPDELTVIAGFLDEIAREGDRTREQSLPGSADRRATGRPDTR